MEGFNDELEAFKDCVRGQAKLHIKKVMKEYEEEECKQQLGRAAWTPLRYTSPSLRNSRNALR